MLTGYKVEANESHFVALTRELHEELNNLVPAYLPNFVGQFTAPAANEKGYTVHAHLYTLYWTGAIQVGAEIKQAHWFSPDNAQELHLAPLARRVIRAGFILQFCFKKSSSYVLYQTQSYIFSADTVLTNYGSVHA